MSLGQATALPPSYPPWIEDSLSSFCPQITGDRKGLEKLIANFMPIHEGGELVSPPVPLWITQTSLYREGEVETGPTATAWHSFKYINPADSGAVLPIVDVKGFKIFERTIYGFRSRADGTEFWASKGDADAALRSEIAGLRSKWAAREEVHERIQGEADLIVWALPIGCRQPSYPPSGMVHARVQG
ncbi:XFP N-terminal domain-containing protein [Mycena olivaceomarginata]|nr:XFP N-terminal domain-containing protein [Mycena olivaceomarginata]